MNFDSADNLYVGTGASGVIYKVDKGGKKSVFYTCSDNHVVSFLRDGSNNLLAGTSPAGLIVQISPDGKGFALMDTPLEEVHALALDRFGTIYAVASSAKGAGAACRIRKPEAASRRAPRLPSPLSWWILRPRAADKSQGYQNSDSARRREGIRGNQIGGVRHHQRRKHGDRVQLRRTDGFRRDGP